MAMPGRGAGRSLRACERIGASALHLPSGDARLGTRVQVAREVIKPPYPVLRPRPDPGVGKTLLQVIGRDPLAQDLAASGRSVVPSRITPRAAVGLSANL